MNVIDNYVIVSCGSTIAYIFDSSGDGSCMFRVDSYVQFYMILSDIPIICTRIFTRNIILKCMFPLLVIAFVVNI